MSEHHEQQQERRRLKNQTKALYQAQRRANPVVRSLEQSSDTGRRRIAREVLGVQEQEQSANTQQRVGGVWGGVPPRSSSSSKGRFKWCLVWSGLVCPYLLSSHVGLLV